MARTGKFPGMSVFRQGDKFHAQSSYYDNGKRRYITARADTEHHAVQRLIEKQKTRLLQGNTPQKPKGELLGVLVEKWLAEGLANGKQSRTITGYRQTLFKHIIPTFGETNIKTITSEDLNKHFYSTMKHTGAGAKRNAYNYLRSFFLWAVKHGHITESPLHNVTPPKYQSTRLGLEEKYLDRFINYYRYGLREVAKPENPLHDYYELFLFMGLGLRRSELLGMTWDNISNLNSSKTTNLTINQQLGRYTPEEDNRRGYYINPTTKNHKDRKLPLPKLWKEALQNQKAKGRVCKQKGFENAVWVTPNGKHITYELYREIWQTFLYNYVNKNREHKEALKPNETFRPHLMRHIAVSIMAEQRIPLETIQQVVGHLDQGTTLYYRKIRQFEKEQATNTLTKGYQIES